MNLTFELYKLVGVCLQDASNYLKENEGISHKKLRENVRRKNPTLAGEIGAKFENKVGWATSFLTWLGAAERIDKNGEVCEYRDGKRSNYLKATPKMDEFLKLSFQELKEAHKKWQQDKPKPKRDKPANQETTLSRRILSLASARLMPESFEDGKRLWNELRQLSEEDITALYGLTG